MKLVHTLRSVFTLDLKALALMRICMGLLILLDLCIRSSDLKAHYSDQGLLPLDLLLRREWDPWNFSLHNVSGLWQIQVLLFLGAAFFAILLALGYRTRLVSLISWILLLSLHSRNPLILQGGDRLLSLILFWGIFLPWGKYYSLDRISSIEKTNETSWFGIAGVGYILQIFSVYFFAALIKMPSAEWTSEGTAVYYALSLDQMVFPIGKLLYPYPDLLKFLTFFVFYTELLAPVLFFIPFYNSFFKTLAIILLLALHAGIALTLFVGLFFLIGIVTLIGMLPPAWINKMDEKLAPLKSKISSLGNKLTALLRHVISQRQNIKLSGDWHSPVLASFLSVVIVYSLVWNWQTTKFANFKITGDPKNMGQLLGINQSWGMFAPNVFKDDGWFVLEAKTKDNRCIDIGNEGRSICYGKPANAVSFYKNDRWRKYLENYLFVNNYDIRPYYCNFLINEWNREHSDSIKELKIVYMKEVTRADYLPVQPDKKVLAIANN